MDFYFPYLKLNIENVYKNKICTIKKGCNEGKNSHIGDTLLVRKVRHEPEKGTKEKEIEKWLPGSKEGV